MGVVQYSAAFTNGYTFNYPAKSVLANLATGSLPSYGRIEEIMLRIYCGIDSTVRGKSVTANFTLTDASGNAVTVSSTFIAPTTSPAWVEFGGLPANGSVDYNNLSQIKLGGTNKLVTRTEGATLSIAYDANLACGAPSNLQITPTETWDGTALLIWTAGTSGGENTITGHEVARAESVDGKTWGEWKTIRAAVPPTQNVMYIDPPATIGHYYKYRIRALGSAGAAYYSAWVETSETLRRTAETCSAPSAVKLGATTSPGSTVLLSWTAGAGGTSNAFSGYEVDRAQSVNGSTWGAWERVATTTGTSLAVIPPIPYGHYYKYRVRTMGAAGEEWASAWAACSNVLQKVKPTLQSYTDATLTAGQTVIKAVHMTDLQANINLVRRAWGLADYSFASIRAGYTSLAGWLDSITAMRAAIDEIGQEHEAWIAVSVNCPRADVMMQLRRVVAAL